MAGLAGVAGWPGQMRDGLCATPRNVTIPAQAAAMESFERTQRYIKNLAAFKDTADVYRVPKAGRFVKFLWLFSIWIEGSGPTMTVRAPAAAPRAPAVRRGPDLAPRAPRQGIPGTQAIAFGPNMKRPLTAAFARYERYRCASTVQEARDLGMMPMDLRAAIQSGQGELL